MSKDLSIHPRNWPNGNGYVSNTCKPHGKGKRKHLRKASARLNQRVVAYAGSVESSKSEGFNKPGSMKRKGK